MTALPMIDWQSPDTTPDVPPGSYEWFWVAIERHGRVVSLPATYLNAMPLDRDDTDPIERAESGNHWRNEPPGENGECVMLATGWHESREHSDYDGFYSPLLDDKATLVAWKAVERWTADRQPAAVAVDAVRAPLPVPSDILEARAQGRAEALAIILGLDAEEGLDDYTASIPPGPAGEWGTAWNEEKLRELLRADDSAWSLLQEAEGEYWHNLGLREEAERLSAAPAAPESGKVVVREAALRLAVRELNHARKGVDSAGRANYVHRLLLAMLDEEPIHDVAETAAPAPVAGDAVRDAVQDIRGVEKTLMDAEHYGLADKLKDALATLTAALAQDRASQAGAAGVPEGWRLVPERMTLTPQDIQNLLTAVDLDSDAGDVEDRYATGILIVGTLNEGSDDEHVHGLHVYSAEYPDEGCTTLVKFAAPTPAAGEGT